MLKQVLMTVFLLISSTVIACDDLHIPTRIEILGQNKVPTRENPIILRVIAPKEYQGWELSGGAYIKGESQIPFASFADEDPKVEIFELFGTSEIFSGSKLALTYTPKPRMDESGEILYSLCGHIEEVQWGI